MKYNSIALIGSVSSNAKILRIARTLSVLEPLKIKFGQPIKNILKQSEIDLAIISVGSRNIASACACVNNISKSIDPKKVLIVTAVKDVDLIFTAMQNGIHQIILDTDNPIALRMMLTKKMQMLDSKKSRKKILAIGAHPDDVEIGCGGTLIKHKENGDDVTVLTLSEGARGGDVNQRRNESICAAKYLAANLIHTNLKDTEISSGPETISIIQKAINKINPDIIYTHSLSDTHQDHRATHYATLVAARNANKIFAYLAPSGTIGFQPRLFEHIEMYLNNKLEAINCYVSQTSEYRRPYLTDSIIRSTAQYWGRFSSYGMVEPFEVIRA